ncbi:serine hydrolase domain-containing protein [Brumicola blandensis]|uniref:Serine hydrolase domain-containing protein n=1 Tax=Brumicola blandensis TaxID=3075611 RepID=A0AAW8QWC7_9ALTE|nr:serine hydrolase domain-containing protein [Alteromonas sp. W409]MDT0581094.1 serine hydrolase domain-containing protein [Alteromonas sp. W409]
MIKYVILILFFSGSLSSVAADTTHNSVNSDIKHPEYQKVWNCYTASDAQARKKQVTEGILPYMVFEGETKPVSVETRMSMSKTPAFSVAVIHQGKLDWSEAWGKLQNDGSNADCGSLFQAGSLAKPFTLLAALRMKAAGLVDFDQDIETYFSSYRLPEGQQSKANPITLRNLLSHTAGIVRGGYAGYAKSEQMPTDEQIVRGEAPSNSRKVEVVNEPGASLAYSGGGYTLIEIALKDELNKPFELIMRDWLLDPVGMKQADFTVPLPISSHPHTARGHQIDGGIVAGGWNNYPEQAAAGLWATARDLAMFLLEMHKGYHGKSNVFTQASIEEILATPIANHAYGFRLINDGNNQVFITHYGGTVGYRAGITMNLRTGNGAVFLANSDNGANLGEEFFSAVSRAYEWPVFREKVIKRVKLSPEVLQSLTGTYIFPAQGWKVSVVNQQDSLRFVFPAGNRLPLTMIPIQGSEYQFAHETGVIARFFDEGNDLKIHLFGQTGKRQQ